jgi:hypothetical protein
VRLVGYLNKKLYSDVRTDLTEVVRNRSWAEGVRYIFPTEDDHLMVTTCPVSISGLSQQMHLVMLCMITTHYSCYDIKGTDTTLGIINNQFKSCLHEPIFGFVNAYTQVLKHNPYKQHFNSVIYSSHYRQWNVIYGTKQHDDIHCIYNILHGGTDEPFVLHGLSNKIVQSLKGLPQGAEATMKIRSLCLASANMLWSVHRLLPQHRAQ